MGGRLMRGHFVGGHSNGGKGGVNPFFLHQVPWLKKEFKPMTEDEEKELSEFLQKFKKKRQERK